MSLEKPIGPEAILEKKKKYTKKTFRNLFKKS